MRWRHCGFRIADFGLAMVVAIAACSAAQAQDPLNLEVHELSFWLVDPTIKQANAKDQFSNALPGLAGTLRGTAGPAKSALAPLFLLSFHGEPADRLDVDLRAPAGRFLGHWPRGEEKSRRLRWLNIALAKDFDEQRRAYVSADHWFARARQLDALEIKQNLRSERVIAYDAEVDLPVPLVLAGGPDRYQVRSTAPWPLADLVLCLPTDEGLRVGWVDEVPAAPATAGGKKDETPKPDENTAKPADTSHAPATSAPVALPAGVAPVAATTPAKPQSPNANNKEPEKQEPSPPTGPAVEVVMSAPLKADAAARAAQTVEAWKLRLSKTGLTPGEIELLVSQYAQSVFEPQQMVALFRLPPSTVEEKLSLEILPEPKKVVRVAWVLALNINPGLKDETSALVARLGHASYREREAAEKRLAELGALARPALEEAVKSPDLEIVHRAERLLRRFKGPGEN